jgi:O-antigen ligase
MTTGQAATNAGHKGSIASSVEPTQQRERTPWLLAFLCLVIPALPSYVVPAGPIKSYGSPARAISFLLFGLAILGFILIRRTAKTRTLRPGVALILLFLLLQLAIFGFGLRHQTDELVRANAYRVFFGMVAFTGVTLCVLTRVTTTRQRTILLGCLAVGLTFACTVGLLQETGIDLRFLFKPPGFVSNADWDFTLINRLGVPRITGTSGNPLEFSVMAAVAVLLTLHLARHAATRRGRWLAALACGVALLALPAAVSRSGVVSLAAGLLVYIWNFKARNIAFVAAGAAVGIFGYIAFLPARANALWQTIVNSQDDPSIEWRTARYALVGDSFRAYPVFGQGLGVNVSNAVESKVLDNEWLRALVQGGMVGVTAMAIVVCGGIFGITAALRTASTQRERDQAFVLGAIFVAIISSSVTMDLFACQQATLTLFISFGLLWSNFTVPLPDVGTTRTSVFHDLWQDPVASH